MATALTLAADGRRRIATPTRPTAIPTAPALGETLAEEGSTRRIDQSSCVSRARWAKAGLIRATGSI
jgi:hypothetical protein